LLEELWKKGYLKADVEVKREGSEQDSIRHIFKITSGSVYKEVELRFEGAKSYNTKRLEEELKNLYGSREEMVIDAFHRFPTFSERIEALYIQNGFLDAKAEDGAVLFREDGTAQREILIHENQPARVEDVEVTNHNGFPPELVARLKALPGRLYTPSLLSEDLITATEYYEGHGYPNVDISSDVVRRAGDPRLLIRYNLNPGNQIRIGSIRILGNYSTRRAVIERRLTFREGDLLVKSQLYESQRLLYKTHVFQQVRIEPEESDQANIYNVNVEVTESKKYRFTYGVRYDSENNVGGDIILEDTRLFGTAHSLSFFTRANSIEQTAGFTYTMPSIWGVTKTGSAYPTGWDMLIQLRWEREDLETFVSQREILDVQKQFRLIGPFIIVGEYSYERVDSRGVFFDAIRSISSLTGTVVADTRDEPINAHRGYFISLENTFAPSFLKGDVLFKRLYYQFFYFRPFGKIVWANGFRIGLAYPEDQRLLEDERFRAGGASTVRGFKLNELGPRDIFGDPSFGESLLIFNEEVRFPVYKWIGGVAFYDAGNIYNKASDLSFSDLRHSVGLGIRLNTPFGVGRFDVGFNLDPQFDEPSRVYHFGFGQSF
ncbi:MAG TPA: BamA/TamA family outer membrane protein, partial [Acidobacteriota bacterium]|nr:BamA/TamA family outer membrane protein [Acidobacteriota bacterium]